MQQAARLGHALYICYVDLATFFPSIDRGLVLEHELLAGVPRDVLDLAAAITSDDPRLALRRRRAAP